MVKITFKISGKSLTCSDFRYSLNETSGNSYDILVTFIVIALNFDKIIVIISKI